MYDDNADNDDHSFELINCLFSASHTKLYQNREQKMYSCFDIDQSHSFHDKRNIYQPLYIWLSHKIYHVLTIGHEVLW